MSANASVTAKHLDVSRQWLTKLTDEGILQRLSDGGYDLDDARVRYIQHLRDRRAKPDKYSALIAARTKVAEVRADRESKKLWRECMDAATAMVNRVSAALFSDLDSLPARFSRDLQQRRRLKELIDDIRRAEVARMEKEREREAA